MNLIGHTSDIASVAISSDNSLVVSGSWDTTVKIWIFNCGMLTKDFKDSLYEVDQVLIS